MMPDCQCRPEPPKTTHRQSNGLKKSLGCRQSRRRMRQPSPTCCPKNSFWRRRINKRGRVHQYALFTFSDGKPCSLNRNSTKKYMKTARCRSRELLPHAVYQSLTTAPPRPKLRKHPRNAWLYKADEELFNKLSSARKINAADYIQKICPCSTATKDHPSNAPSCWTACHDCPLCPERPTPSLSTKPSKKPSGGTDGPNPSPASTNSPPETARIEPKRRWCSNT